MAHNDNFTMGAQGQFIRFQHAQWALVKIPGKPEDYSEGMLKSLLTLSDVMATGYHAARTARVQTGDTVIVLGDGAVGQCGIIAAKMMGAMNPNSRFSPLRASVFFRVLPKYMEDVNSLKYFIPTQGLSRIPSLGL